MKYYILVAVVLVSNLALVHAADEEQREAVYTIDAKLVIKGETVSRPQLSTIENEPFSIKIGRDLELPAVRRPRRLFEGLELSGVTYRHEGQLILDLTFRISKPRSHTNSKRLRVTSITTDIIQPVQLNEPIEVELDGAGTCLGIRVSEMLPAPGE